MAIEQPYRFPAGAELSFEADFSDYLANEGATLGAFEVAVGPKVSKVAGSESETGGIIRVRLKMDASAREGFRTFANFTIRGPGFEVPRVMQFVVARRSD